VDPGPHPGGTRLPWYLPPKYPIQEEGLASTTPFVGNKVHDLIGVDEHTRHLTLWGHAQICQKPAEGLFQLVMSPGYPLLAAQIMRRISSQVHLAVTTTYSMALGFCKLGQAQPALNSECKGFTAQGKRPVYGESLEPAAALFLDIMKTGFAGHIQEGMDELCRADMPTPT